MRITRGIVDELLNYDAKMIRWSERNSEGNLAQSFLLLNSFLRIMRISMKWTNIYIAANKQKDTAQKV